MSVYTQTSDEDAQYLLVAKLDNVKSVANIIKAINFKETAIMFGTDMGIKVTVEDSKSIQSNAFIQASLFHEYALKEPVAFKINLVVLIDCLTIFGSSPGSGVSSSMKMCYQGYGYPLILVLEEDGVLTDCSIKTMEADEILDFNFCNTNVLNKIIMKSDCLKEAFSELDLTSEVLEILTSPDHPYFRLTTFGISGSCHSDFSRDSDVIESFQCTQTCKERYKMSLLKPTVKTLAISTRVSIRTDNRGFLSLQYMINNDDGQVSFIEFFCVPDKEVDDDDR